MDNIYKKLLAAQAEVGKVSKDAFVQTNKTGAGYNAVSHDNVTSATREVLIKHGIFVRSSIVEHNLEKYEVVGYDGKTKLNFLSTVKVQVDFINADNPEEMVTQFAWGYGMDSQDKGIGKAYSYAHKYALLKGLSLWTGDNDEGRPQGEATRVPNSAYLISFGKYKGMKLEEVGNEGLEGYVEYIEGAAKKNGKPLTPQVADFVKRVEEHLGVK